LELQLHLLSFCPARTLLALAAVSSSCLLPLSLALRRRQADVSSQPHLPLPALILDASSSSLSLSPPPSPRPDSPSHKLASPSCSSSASLPAAAFGSRQWVLSAIRLRIRLDESRQTLAAGAMHSLLVSRDGTLLSCGVEKVVGVDGATVLKVPGLLGHGLLTEPMAGLRLPTPIPMMTGVRVRSVAANGRHSLALSWEGAVYSWGCGEAGKLGHGNEQPQLEPRLIEGLTCARVHCIAAGWAHSLCATDDGEVFSWGCGADGRCGHGGTDNVLEPRRVPGLAAIAVLTAGGAHSVAASIEGVAYSWGRLGMGRPSSEPQLVPNQIKALTGLRVVGLAAGDEHSLALTQEGRVFAWGVAALGRLGISPTPPVEAPASTAAPSDQRLRELEPKLETRVVDCPTEVIALRCEHVCAVAAGFAHSIALTRAGRIYSWGCGASGRLGHGGDSDFRQPALVEALADVGHAGAIAAGEAHSLAAAADGRGFGWGGRLVGLGVGVGAPTAVVRSCQWRPQEYPPWLRIDVPTHWQ